eukprot:271740-Amorphochlora_amoeboformis.AAC.1
MHEKQVRLNSGSAQCDIVVHPEKFGGNHSHIGYYRVLLGRKRTSPGHIRHACHTGPTRGPGVPSRPHCQSESPPREISHKTGPFARQYRGMKGSTLMRMKEGEMSVRAVEERGLPEAQIIDGKSIANRMREEVRKEVEFLRQ